MTLLDGLKKEIFFFNLQVIAHHLKRWLTNITIRRKVQIIQNTYVICREGRENLNSPVHRLWGRTVH